LRIVLVHDIEMQGGAEGCRLNCAAVRVAGARPRTGRPFRLSLQGLFDLTSRRNKSLRRFRGSSTGVL
jgi:hypothetical protein